MSGLLPVVLAALLAAEPIPVERPTRPGVQAAALFGAGLLAAGLIFEIAGRAGSDPVAPVLELRPYAQANTIGGVALISGGLCFITIAALLTPWRLPSIAVIPTAGGAMFSFGAVWP